MDSAHNLPKELAFIRDNWYLICSLWNDIDNNNIYYCVVDNNNQACWLDNFATGFIRDIYGVYDRANNYCLDVLVTDVSSLIFEPDHLYQFTISEHEFIIICQQIDDAKILYYVDYMQFGRKSSYPLFRLETITIPELTSYLEKYLAEDFAYHTQFHHCTKTYQKYYTIEYHKSKKLNGQHNYTQLAVSTYKMQTSPTISSIITVLENSLTQAGIDDAKLTAPWDAPTWLDDRNTLLNRIIKAS